MGDTKYVKNRGSVRLAAAIREAGTQVRLADRIGIDQGYLSSLHRGRRRPGLRYRLLLEDALGIPIRAWDEDLPPAESASEARRLEVQLADAAAT